MNNNSKVCSLHHREFKNMIMFSNDFEQSHQRIRIVAVINMGPSKTLGGNETFYRINDTWKSIVI